MRFFTIIGVIFYTTVLSLVGLFIIFISLNWLGLETINNWLNYLHTSFQIKLISSTIGVLLILISISFAQLILGKIQREKTIAFSSPSGKIIISLSAVEDLIMRTLRVLNEIKDVHPDVIATKKGINVDLKISLKSEVNIPEFTAHLQETIKGKIQDIIGIEEPIEVNMHILKIVSKQDKAEEKESGSTSTPFYVYHKF